MNDHTDGTNTDPHSEYRRQTAQHFGTVPASPPPTAGTDPRIFRADQVPPGDDTNASGSPATGSDTPPTPLTYDATPTLRAPSSRFAAGTTYTGNERQQVPPPMPQNAPPIQQALPRIQAPPTASAPPQAAWGGWTAPATPPHPYVDPHAAASLMPPPAIQYPTTPVGPQHLPQNAGTGQVLFDVQPYHVFRVLAGLSAVIFLLTLPTIDFLLIALGCGVGEWYTRTRRVAWPSDITDLLAGMRLAVPKAPQAQVLPRPPAAPIIPFRPMTIPEMLGGAIKIVLNNWPTLVGIPLAILVTFGAVLGVVMTAVFAIFFSATMSMSDSLTTGATNAGGLIASLVVMVIVMYVIVWAVALPTDAMLIGASVIATGKAVRGEPVRFGEVFRMAWARMFGLCRLTLTFYAIFIIPEYLIFLLIGVTAGFLGAGFFVLWLVVFGASFVLGIVFSLAPIVFVVEGGGVGQSLKRSAQLAKPAAGRLIGIHLLWVACILPLFIVTMLLSVFASLLGLLVLCLGFPILIAFFRTLQMLIYVDLRIRAENYDRELIADWTRNATP